MHRRLKVTSCHQEIALTFNVLYKLFDLHSYHLENASVIFIISTGWAKSRYTVIFFFFTGIVNDGRELKYRTKKVDVKQLNLNVKLTNVNI